MAILAAVTAIGRNMSAVLQNVADTISPEPAAWASPDARLPTLQGRAVPWRCAVSETIP